MSLVPLSKLTSAREQGCARADQGVDGTARLIHSGKQSTPVQ